MYICYILLCIFISIASIYIYMNAYLQVYIHKYVYIAFFMISVCWSLKLNIYLVVISS